MNILSGTVRTIRNAGSWAILRVCQSYRQPLVGVVNRHCPNDLHCYSTANKHSDGVDDTNTNTINDEEVALFSRHANEWWNETGEFIALHSLNELRVPLVRDALLAQNASSNDAMSFKPKPLAGFNILDVGCGGGILSEPLARLGATVTGIDASDEGIKVAQWHKTLDPEALSRLNYRCAAIENIATTEAETYDGLVASEILEHVNDQRGFVAACCQLVKPGGSVFFTTLNRSYLSYALGIVAAERILRIVPAGAHDWNKFVLPDELQDMISENDMNVRLVHGMMFNPLTSRWSWISGTSINYAIHAVKMGKSASSSDSSSSSDSDSDSSPNPRPSG